MRTISQRLIAHGIPVVGCIAVAVAATVTWLCPFAPRVHDEFSYLLAADTLLHGRLANPTPEFWQPFQSFHIILEPSYASKYPLGPGAIIALGWLVFGTAIAGSWIGAGLCASSVAWALQGVTCRRWALVGGLLVAVHPAMQVTWSQSLMNGWLTAAASALLVGGVLRLRRRVTHFSALAVGSGIAGLALTRPFEGLVATGLSAAMLWAMWQRHNVWDKLWRAFALVPVASIPVSLALALMAAQNFAVSGSLTRLPYQIHEASYGVAPLFVFGHPHTPLAEASGEQPDSMRRFHRGWSLTSFERRAGWMGWLTGVRESCETVWEFWFLLAGLPVLTSPFWARFRVARLLAFAILTQMLLSSTVCWIFSHYLAPLLPWLVILTVIGLRRAQHFLRQWSISSQQCATIALAVQCIVLLIATSKLKSSPHRNWALHRVAIEDRLSQLPGQHLVLVQYGDDHNVHQEWVYNGSDLAASKVLWARGEREDWNRKLHSDFGASHFIWQLQVNDVAQPPRLISRPKLVTNQQVLQPSQTL